MTFQDNLLDITEKITFIGIKVKWVGGMKGVLLTTVGIDVVRLKEANLEVVQDGRFVQVAECREVIFSHQDVRVPQEGKRVAVSTHRVLKRLRQPDKQRL